MTTPVDAEETCSGACHTEKCANGGRCIDMIQQWECDCSGTGYEGETCSTGKVLVNLGLVTVDDKESFLRRFSAEHEMKYKSKVA